MKIQSLYGLAVLLVAVPGIAMAQDVTLEPIPVPADAAPVLQPATGGEVVVESTVPSTSTTVITESPVVTVPAPVCQQRVVTTYHPATVVTTPVTTVYRVAPIPAVAPVVTYRPAFVAPFPFRPYPVAPVGFVRPKVYYPGFPIRNTIRAFTP